MASIRLEILFSSFSTQNATFLSSSFILFIISKLSCSSISLLFGLFSSVESLLRSIIAITPLYIIITRFSLKGNMCENDFQKLKNIFQIKNTLDLVYIPVRCVCFTLLFLFFHYFFPVFLYYIIFLKFTLFNLYTFYSNI